MKRFEIMLPKYWASYFVNGDMSGMDDSDCEAIGKTESEIIAECGNAFCVDVKSDGACNFMAYHWAHDWFPYASDCCEFVFFYDEGKA